jgi:hypothetical protein
MKAKKLLIIQLDEAYFLFETLQVLERNRQGLHDFELTVLTSFDSLKQVFNNTAPTLPGLTIDKNSVLKEHYDLSINFSLNESSWDFHAQVKSDNKIGPWKQDGILNVPDLWSSYMLTLKARAPFLTFHMQDIYKNILGLKAYPNTLRKEAPIKTIAFGTLRPDLFAASEQEKLINEISKSFPFLSLKDLSEIDVVEDLSSVLYIGPASFEALKLCEGGALGLYIGSIFQGLNLLPYQEGHYFVSSREKKIESKVLLPLIESFIQKRHLPDNYPYSVYRIEHENIFGAFLRALNNSDDNYPFYQSHVVLWNYLLNLFDTNLEVIRCSDSQIELLKTNKMVLNKFQQLHRYAMSSIDFIQKEAKSPTTDSEKIQGHMKNLKEVEAISDQISQAHSFLRPFLDFYRIRKGQNDGSTLKEQSQNTFMVYSEEYQALNALDELFTVTLLKNEVTI